jgi:hypothetical protein
MGSYFSELHCQLLVVYFTLGVMNKYILPLFLLCVNFTQVCVSTNIIEGTLASNKANTKRKTLADMLVRVGQEN